MNAKTMPGEKTVNVIARPAKVVESQPGVVLPVMRRPYCLGRTAIEPTHDIAAHHADERPPGIAAASYLAIVQP
jgi:hypothetical protein